MREITFSVDDQLVTMTIEDIRKQVRESDVCEEQGDRMLREIAYLESAGEAYPGHANYVMRAAVTYLLAWDGQHRILHNSPDEMMRFQS